MTSSAWLAVGTVVASLLGSGLQPQVLVLLAAAVGVAAAGGRVGSRDLGVRRWVHALGPASIGALAIALRLSLAAGTDPSTPSLPAGHGPWAAEVIAVSAPRNGAQVATLRMELPG